MSRTQIRNGRYIQDALFDVSREKSIFGGAFTTVGEVAQRAGCSKPTALKYLKMLQQYGMARGEKLLNGQWIWVSVEIYPERGGI